MERDHQTFMECALEEARKGLGRTSPNPAVGAVIVKDGVIVGRGYHRKAGTPHAEVHAIADAGSRTAGATIYVTLEPCNHTGRTPPCTQAILRAGITTVIIGMLDPNPRVAGGGAASLREQGIEVVSGVLEERCRALNYPFIKHSATGLPWVIMKAGLSLDGKITFAPRRGAPLTGPASQQYVHRLRNQVDAILIGVETARIDDPSLTTRLEGVANTRDPLRIVLDTRLRLSPRAQMLNQTSVAATWVFCTEDAPLEREQSLTAAGAVVHRLPPGADGRIPLPEVFRFLGQREITSVLVEGGATIHGALYGQQLADEILFLYAPFIVGDQGTPLVSGYSLDHRPQTPLLDHISLQPLDDDFLFRALVRR
jgi:diaminohydroxyphosphoribosylaminopyrimidine deaminase/5-amino-6-(5-phosphoribosylamino)uracil reductase